MSNNSPDTFKALLKLLVNKPLDFQPEHLEEAIEHISTPGHTTPSQLGAWLTALKWTAKEREPDFVASYARLARSKALPVDLPGRHSGEWVVDIVGTGGDGQDTFNASTAAAIIAAGAGARVCKHGSKASTSKSGSADFLTALDIPITSVKPADLPLDSRFLFLFAINFHPTFAITGPIRRELGFPTIYNLLGPLINPARPDAMVLGVYDESLGLLFAQALKSMKMKRAWVVCGLEGLDEISPAGPTNVWDLTEDGTIRHFRISPSDFGLAETPLDSVRSGTSSENAALFLRLLNNQEPEDSPVRTFVVLNTAALLVVSGIAKDLKEGVQKAVESIESGKALQVLNDFKAGLAAGAKK